MKYSLELLMKLREIADLLKKINKRSAQNQPCYALGERALRLAQGVIDTHAPLSKSIEQTLIETILMAHSVMQQNRGE